MKHNHDKPRTVKMPDHKIKPTLFRYHDFFIEILMERFGDDEKKKWSKSNPNLEPSLIDTYIKWFDELRKSKPTAAITINIDGVPTGHDRFDISKYKDWTSFESFVDAVRAQIPMGCGKFTTQLEIDGKPLFEKNGLEVYYADTPRACIKYKGNVPYSWCIARHDSSNMFYTYRMKNHQPAFYFVKDVEETKKELGIWSLVKATFSGKFKNPYHFFVIQVLKDAKIDNTNEKSYIVTSANNDGDKQMSWNEIVNIQPKLKGLQKEFLPKPLSSEEQAKVNKYKNGITSQEFATLPYEEKERFLDIYPSIGKPISDEIFEVMPDKLMKNKYIGFGIGMTDKQYNIVKNDTNLLKRYIQITERKFEEWLKTSNRFKLVGSEMDVLIKYNILDKYIDKLSDNNVYNLLSSSNNQQQTIEFLLSKGMNIDKIVKGDVVYYMLNSSTDKQQTIEFLLSKGLSIDKILTDYNVRNLLSSSNNKQQTIEFLLNKGLSIDKILTGHAIFDLLSSSNNKQQTIEFLLSKGMNIDKIVKGDIVYSLLYNSIDKQKTIEFLLNKGMSIDKILTGDVVYSLLLNSNNLQQTIDLLLSKGLSIDKILTGEVVYSLLRNSNNLQQTINVLFNKNVPLIDNNVENLLHYSTDKQQTIDLFLSKNIPLTDHNIFMLLQSSTNKQQTIEFLLSKGLSIDKIFTDRNVSILLRDSPNKQQTIDLFLNNGLSIDKILTGDVVYSLLRNSNNLQQTIEFLLSKGLSINKILTDHIVYFLIRNSNNLQKTIDLFLRNGLIIDKILTGDVVYSLLNYSTDKQKTIEFLLSKNVPLTDNNVENLLQYSPNKPDTQLKINALKAKQQLSESKFRYRDFFI